MKALTVEKAQEIRAGRARDTIIGSVEIGLILQVKHIVLMQQPEQQLMLM